MIKFILIIVFLTCTAANVFAQEPTSGMRDLAVAQMFEYGKSMYERGDRAEATHIFKRILQLNPDYVPAQAYAKRLGIIHVIQAKKIQAVPVSVPAPAAVIALPVDLNQDLRDEIAQEDVHIAQLISEIAALRASGVKRHE